MHFTGKNAPLQLKLTCCWCVPKDTPFAPTGAGGFFNSERQLVNVLGARVQLEIPGAFIVDSLLNWSRLLLRLLDSNLAITSMNPWPYLKLLFWVVGSPKIIVSK